MSDGTASPGAIAHLYRDGRADEYADLVIASIVGGPVVLYGVGDGRFSTERTVPPIGPSDVGVARVSVLLNLSAGCGALKASPGSPNAAVGSHLCDSQITQNR